MSAPADRFKVEDGKVVFDSGKVGSFNYEVAEALGFETAVVARLEVPVGVVLNENVYGLDYEGRMLWQVPVRKHVYTDSPYTKITRSGDAVVLSNWDGLELTLDPETGRVLGESHGK
jgi:outer membrane protein assembly factor BamB